jgi:hypothetical protein
VIAELRTYVLGWKGYFGLAQTPGVFAGLDEWMRHRRRAIQLKHWKRGTTMDRELLWIGRFWRWRPNPTTPDGSPPTAHAGGETAAQLLTQS